MQTATIPYTNGGPMRALLPLLAVFLTFTGCREAESRVTYLEGTVVKEDGTLPTLLSSTGAMIGNDSIKVGEPSYIIHIKSGNNLYVLEITQSDKNQTMVGLCSRIENGAVVRFPLQTRNVVGDLQPVFSKSKIGTLEAFQIEIVRDKSAS